MKWVEFDDVVARQYIHIYSCFLHFYEDNLFQLNFLFFSLALMAGETERERERERERKRERERERRKRTIIIIIHV